MANYYITVTNIYYVTGVETGGEAYTLVEDYEDSGYARHPQVTFKDQNWTEEKDN